MSSPPLNIMVVATGAVGAIFASRVGQSSRTRVTTVCRSNYNSVLEHGIHLDTVIWGRTNFRPHSVIQGTSQAALFGEKYDYVALATKAFSNTRHSISELLRPVVGKGTTLISIQNGLDVEKPLQEAFPQNPVLSAICYVNCIVFREREQGRVESPPRGFELGKIRLLEEFHVPTEVALS